MDNASAKQVKSFQPYMTENRFAKIFTMCALYFAQGVPFGFVTFLLASYMSARDFSMKDVGNLTAIATLPWTIKWIWGPMIDRYTYRPMGRRRPWIIFAQLFMVLTMAIMVFFKDITANINVLFILVFINNVFASMQDVSVDALAVEILEEKERGLANGLMFGSASGGSAFSGIVLMQVLNQWGMRMAIVVQSIVLCMIMMLPLIFRERRGEKLLPWTKGKPMGTENQETAESFKVFFKYIGKAFSIRSALIMIAACLLMKIAVELHGVMGTVYYIQQLGWTDTEFAGTLSAMGFLALAGCFIGGPLGDFFGHKKIAIISIVLFAASYFWFALQPNIWINKTMVRVFFGMEAAFYGSLSVCMFAMCMDICLPVVAGTQFTAYMAMSNLSATIGKKTANYFYELFSKHDLLSFFHVSTDALSPESIGYGSTLIFWGFFQLIVVGLLFALIDPHERKKALAVQNSN